MRRILFSLAVLSGLLTAAHPVRADDLEAYGMIQSVDVERRQVSIRGDDGKTYTFNTNPATEVEIKRKILFDTKGKLKDLKQGDWVKIEYKMTSPTFFIAKEIEVYREK